MKEQSMTIAGLLGHLQDRQNLNNIEIEKIQAELEQQATQVNDPIYIKILAGIGAWFAAFFLILFLGLANLIESGVGAIIIGILFFIAAIILVRLSTATFPNQLALALAISGNALVLYGPVKLSSGNFEILTLAIIQTVLCLVIYPLFASTTYRYLAPIFLVLLVTIWIVTEHVHSYIQILIGAETLLLGILSLHKKRSVFLSPLLYSAATMLPATLLYLNLSQVNLWGLRFQTPFWISNILIAGAIIYLFINLAGDLKRLDKPWLILAIGSSILLSVFTTPGILVVVGLLVLGHNYEDRLILGIAYLFLPLFLILYYYALNVNLAHKSWILVGSGLILLAVRWISDHFLDIKKEAI